MPRLADLLDAIGGFHPLIIHLPIGLLAGVACLELWMAIAPRSAGRAAVGPLLWLASAAAAVAAVCGLLLARAGTFDAALLDSHRSLGLAGAACTVLAGVLYRPRSAARGWRVGYRLALLAAVAATCGAGHYGGIIAHGRTPWSALFTVLRGGSVNGATSGAGAHAVASDDLLYARSVAPILEAHCRECHGAVKQENGLRLDSRAAALSGGKSGQPAIVPGDAMASRLVEAITLPADHKRAMPPSGKQRLTAEQVLALIDWINRGASWPDTDGLRFADVGPPPAHTLAALNAAGFRASVLAENHPLVRVDRVPPGARLAALKPLAAHIAWLRLDGFTLAPGDLEQLSDMANLTRLELQHSNVRDADLVAVAQIPHLTDLNLYATAVSDAGLAHLRALGTLKRLYLWQTAVTPAGVERLREDLPNARIDQGLVGTERDDPPPQPPPSA